MFDLIVLTASLLTPISAFVPDEALQLAGTVLSDAEKPVAGANVFISTAGPRKGVGVL